MVKTSVVNRIYQIACTVLRQTHKDVVPQDALMMDSVILKILQRIIMPFKTGGLSKCWSLNPELSVLQYGLSDSQPYT